MLEIDDINNAEISRIKKKMLKSIVLPQDEEVKKSVSF